METAEPKAHGGGHTVPGGLTLPGMRRARPLARTGRRLAAAASPTSALPRPLTGQRRLQDTQRPSPGASAAGLCWPPREGTVHPAPTFGATACTRPRRRAWTPGGARGREIARLNPEYTRGCEAGFNRGVWGDGRGMFSLSAETLHSR